MIGLGVALTHLPVRARIGGVSVAVPTPAPSVPAPPVALLVYLPPLETAGAAWHVLLSNERLLAGYDGPLALVGNGAGVSGSNALGAGATGLAAGDLPAPVTGLYGWFDQTGAGRHFVQDTLANRPRLRAEVTLGGRLAAAFWGVENRAGARASLDGAQALAAGNRTEVWVVDPSSIQNGVFAEHDVAGGSPVRFTYTAPGGGGVLCTAGGATDAVAAAQPQVWVVVDGPAGRALFVNGVKHAVPGSAATGATIARTTLGWSPASGIGSTVNARIAAYGAIAGAVDDADAGAISAALAARFGVGTAAPTLNVVHIGDSIVEGVNATDTIGLKAMLLPRLPVATRYVNLGISGKKLADCYADRQTYEAALFRPGARNVALIDAAINDLCFGSEGAALYAQVTTPYVAALAAMGYDVGVVTVLPQDSTAYGVPVSAQVVEARRQAYNSAVRGNAAGAAFVVDRATGGMEGFPAACDDPSLYPDALHPSTAGYALLAPVYAAAINARRTN